jgi:hypothetical protein
MTAKEVVKAAAAKGIKFTDTYVYWARTAAKGSAKKAVKGRLTPATNGARGSSDGRVETLLEAAAAEIGLGRAIAILESERERVRAILSR